jgi:signal transduction histidine kinase
VIARIVRPIRALREGMAAFAEGRPVPASIDAPSDEIGALVGAFQDMTRQLTEAKEKLSRSERLSALGQVAGTVSHELRNPLAAIRNSIQLVQQLTAGKNLGIERALDRIDRNIERCNRIVGDILEFTRAKQLDRRTLEFDSWLSDMLDEHDVPGGVPVERDLRCNSAVSIDSTRFRQVIVNLVDNAAQALTDRSWQAAENHAARIVVRTEQAGPHIRLSVRDNGPGIPEDKLPKIFEPLFTTKASGVGLGLPTVRQLVEQHGGTVDVASTVGQGTTFTIWLPRYSAEAAAQGAFNEAVAAA